MSTLFVDTITEKTSGNGVQIPGHVLQVVRKDPTVDWSGSRWSGTGTSFSKGFMELTITPKETSSLIIIRAEIMGYMGSGASYFYHTLKRNVSGGSSTDLGLATNTAGLVCNQLNSWNTQHINYVDAPNTTSAITYEIWHRNHVSSGTSYVGWAATSGNTHDMCFMELMEIAQ